MIRTNGKSVKLLMRLGRVEKEISERALLAFWVATVSALCMFRDLIGIGFPDIIFSGLCGMAFLSLGYGTSLGLFIFTTPLTVPHNEIMIIYIVALLLKQYYNDNFSFHSRIFSVTVCILILQLVDMVLFFQGSISTLVYEYITRMLYIVIPMLWYCSKISVEEANDAIICYVWGAILGAGIVLFLTGKSVGWNNLLRGEGFWRMGITIDESTQGMQTTYNANQLAGMMALSVSLILGLIERKKINVIVGFICIGFAALVIAMTKSRSGLLCACGAGIMYLGYVLCSSKKRTKGILYLGIAVVAVVLVVNAFPELFSGIMERFEGQEDITGGRTELFLMYIQEWSSNVWCMFFGYGVGSFQHVLSIHNVPHNAIADILVSWGLAGLILVFTTVGMLFRSVIRLVDRNMRLLACIPVMVASAIVMVGQYLTTGYPHMRLCFLILVMQSCRESQPIKKQI